MSAGTFTYTLALEADDGTVWSAEETLSALRDGFTICGADVFSLTSGHGIDTATDEAEAIVIVQGFATDLNAIFQFGAGFADARKQRGFGWFTSTDSYIDTKEAI